MRRQTSLSRRVRKSFQFDWNGRFPKKRNWALRNCEFRNAWILFLDADERATPAFVSELGPLPNTSHDGFWVSFNNHFMGALLRHGDTFRKLALFRIDAGEYEKIPENFWSGLDMEVHEHPVLQGRIGEIRASLEHHDGKGLRSSSGATRNIQPGKQIATCGSRMQAKNRGKP